MTALNAVARGRTSIGRICLLAAFAAGCGADDEPGSIHVTVTTTGTSLDADGYSVTVADKAQDVTANGETTLADFTPGRYTIELSKVAANCTVTSSNPVTVELGSGADATAAFVVECAIPGVVRVRATTTGWDYDKDGYLIEVEGADARQRVTANGITNLISSQGGTLAVTVTDISPDCIADPHNAASVPAPRPGEVSEIALAFECTTLTGGLTIVLPNDDRGYMVLVDGIEYPPLGTSGLTLDRLPPGAHSIEYLPAYLEWGCTVDGLNPFSTTVAVGVMNDVTMPFLDCSQVLFERRRP